MIFDRLEVKEPMTFEWWLHAANEMQVHNQRDILVVGKDYSFLRSLDLIHPHSIVRLYSVLVVVLLALELV